MWTFYIIGNSCSTIKIGIPFLVFLMAASQDNVGFGVWNTFCFMQAEGSFTEESKKSLIGSNFWLLPTWAMFELMT